MITINIFTISSIALPNMEQYLQFIIYNFSNTLLSQNINSAAIIDSGLWLMLLAGLAYAAHVIQKREPVN